MASPTWKIYVINLERAALRRQFILRQFQKLNITNYEFVAALDGMKAGVENLEQQVDRQNLVRPLLPTEIACAISHKLALERFCSDTAEYAVILEDDVLLPENFVAIAENAIKVMKGDEVVLLSGSLHTRQQFRKIAVLDKHTSLIEAVNPIEQVYFASAYIMSKAVAARHIRAIYPVTDVADSWKYYKLKGAMRDILLAYPYPVWQEVFQSTRGKKAKLYEMINWIIYNKVPILYPFFSERRRREEMNRLKNIELINK